MRGFFVFRSPLLCCCLHGYQEPPVVCLVYTHPPLPFAGGHMLGKKYEHTLKRCSFRWERPIYAAIFAPFGFIVSPEMRCPIFIEVASTSPYVGRFMSYYA